MPFQFVETNKSRQTVYLGEQPETTLYFTATGTEDDFEILDAIDAFVPTLYNGLILQNARADHLGNGVWEIEAPYGKRKPKKKGDSTYSFETTGGTQKITHSKQTVNKYKAGGGTAPDCNGGIGYDGEKVQGCDVIVPIYGFKETHYFGKDDITGAFKAALFFATGKTNSGPFRDFAAGEVLFHGASGSERGDDDWEVSYQFQASPNATGLSVGSISGITKAGWDYLWIRYVDQVDGSALVPAPSAVYVERVYESVDFSTLGIG